jgi:polar amino acid transport system substrate-binding protein
MTAKLPGKGGFMKTLKWWAKGVWVTLFLCFFFCSCAYAQRPIVVAVDGDLAPMKMKDDKGNLTGYEVDMIKAMAEEAGFQVTLVEVPWKDIFSGLEAGKYDAVLSSVSITAERKKKYDFTQPYFSAQQLLVIPKSLAEASLEGKTIAAFEATTGASALRKSAVIQKKFYPLARTELPFKDLADGKIDGVLCDTPVAINHAILNEAYAGKFAITSEKTVLGKPSAREEYGMVVKKGNVEVLTLLNKGLKGVAAKNIDNRLKDKWIKW